jgi:endonuclease/exonuclease/phosphatase family metal-dependent hydrolase
MYQFIRFTTWFIFICLVYNTDNFLFKTRISGIKIGSFNLRRYSLAKATSTNSINSHISKILKRYDLVFLQEIIDASNDNRVINLLLKHLHKQSKSIKYEAIISPPLGSTSYKERLVYLYRQKSSQIQILSSYVYNGSVSKMFERQPFILHMKLSSFGQIIFLGVHFKPDNVYNEFRYLRTVIDELKEKSSIVILGDFNADCSYLSNAKKKEIRKSYFNEFQWLIDDRTETNLLQSCSYDRILVSSGVNHWKKINWKDKTNGTFQFDIKFKLTKQLALQVSDHYPVEVDIY